MGEHLPSRSFASRPGPSARAGRPTRPRPGLKFISPAALSAALGRTPLDQFVIWTGRTACGSPESVRGRAMACIEEVGVPVSLRTLMQRAARLDGEVGLDPDVVRSAVRQHQCAQPAVVFLVRRLPCGDYVAVTDIPFAGALNQRVEAGGLIMGRCGRSYVDAVGSSGSTAADQRIPTRA